MTSPIIMGVRLSELPPEQKAGLMHLVEGELRPEERRANYRVRRVAPHVAPWPAGTIYFTDAEERTWYVLPDGSTTWKTR